MPKPGNRRSEGSRTRIAAAPARGPLAAGRRRARPERQPDGHLYDPAFVSPAEREAIVRWLAGLRPLWEDRFSPHFPPPPGQSQRRLLRPVYWLGNWQFACLGYYRPPRGVHDRCVRAEPFPDVLAGLVRRIEARARARFRGPDLPRGWRLNTCLVNLYGSRREGDAWIDSARVGEHRDFEPGPVASVSLGERALLQFVGPSRRGEPGDVVFEQWLDDGSLQIFGGERWKDRTFHRVQRVDRRGGHELPPAMADFRTRRVNFTFRYVPDEHVVRFRDLSPPAREDVRRYVAELAEGSTFFRAELARCDDRAGT
ncbi:MAG TPA: alpha-ketoglutarate-dependent dioxygenase AlkB [Candidatus Binatia bacterium]|nr:alpha-ketoglutarate-dependent dioxygenase AlkB [Candidatus Binatia bacterium]